MKIAAPITTAFSSALLIALFAGAAAQAEMGAYDDGPTVSPGPAGPACEWVPIEQSMPARECGFNDFSVPNPGIYDCGYAARGGQCVKQCVLKACLDV